MYGKMGKVSAVKMYLTRIRGDKSHDHIEACGLSGAVRSKQADNLSASDIKRDVLDDCA